MAGLLKLKRVETMHRERVGSSNWQYDRFHGGEWTKKHPRLVLRVPVDLLSQLGLCIENGLKWM